MRRGGGRGVSFDILKFMCKGQFHSRNSSLGLAPTKLLSHKETMGMKARWGQPEQRMATVKLALNVLVVCPILLSIQNN